LFTSISLALILSVSKDIVTNEPDKKKADYAS
jgi:hypothetical protein